MAETPDLLLVTIAGEDQPGITARLAALLAGHGVELLDIGQATIHRQLSYGMLLKVPPGRGSAAMKELLYACHEFDLRVRFTPLTAEEYQAWVDGPSRSRWIVQLLGRRMSAHPLARISWVLADQGMNIDVITRLSGRAALDESDQSPLRCIELSARGNPRDLAAMRQQILQVAAEERVDISLQRDDGFRRARRLVCFDMDSTLIETEVIVELARRAGAGDEVHAITEAAMRGELDFKQSLRRRVATLKGLPEAVIDEVAASLPLTEGAETLLAELKRLGFKTAILSGGFKKIGRQLAAQLGIDHIVANELEIKDGKLTGGLVGEIIDGPAKAAHLERLAEAEGISPAQVIAVGDGANDMLMLARAGLGVAFRAKPVVRAGAEATIGTGLDSVLYLIGVRDPEQAAIT